jgi:hypothetical protein
MLRNLDSTRLDALPEYKDEQDAYRELDDAQQVSIPQQ